MYEHRYKHGKQKQIMSLDEFREKLDKSPAPLAHKTFCVLLWHTGVRKSELYERRLSDVTVTEEYAQIDFHKRKKGGEEVPPLKIPFSYYGMTEHFMPYWTGVTTSKKRARMDRLLFPHIKHTKAWEIVKAILGDKYYPHYLRLRKLSAIGKKHGVTHIKAVSGIKSLKALEAYIGFDVETQDEAMRDSE